ncbi:MAG: hypothetical protein ACYC61_09160 [Isosphaeraceae bacterium]
MKTPWSERAARELLARRIPDSGWGYRPDRSPSAEPTVLAALGLKNWAKPTGDSAEAAAAVRSAASWLARLQRPDGSVPSASVPTAPGWTTAHAVLLWSRLKGFLENRRRACAWLLRTEGAHEPLPPSERQVIGHDPTLSGWPWVAGTHSWIEPTAMAIVALCAEDYCKNPRVAEGIRLIRDRAMRGGGWNYGNSEVFGRILRPQPGPTGAALLALAAAGTGDGRVVQPACDYLLRTLPATRSALSVGWGVLGLTASGIRPAEASKWLATAHESCAGRPDSTAELGLLLLANSGAGLLVREPRRPMDQDGQSRRTEDSTR